MSLKQEITGKWAVQVGGENRWFTVGTYATQVLADTARDELLKNGYSDTEVRVKFLNY